MREGAEGWAGYDELGPHSEGFYTRGDRASLKESKGAIERDDLN